ncbi:unnamed protein product, partial [marine sediment metagenome]
MGDDLADFIPDQVWPLQLGDGIVQRYGAREEGVSPAEMKRVVGEGGAGFLLVKREVFEKLPYPWFSFEKGGEDLYFCDKARENGFEIWADMSVLLGHLRLEPVGASQFLTQYQNTAESNEFLGEEPIAHDLAKFLHKTPAYIKRKMRDSPVLESAKRWQEKNPQTLDEVRQYYSETT